MTKTVRMKGDPKLLKKKPEVIKKKPKPEDQKELTFKDLKEGEKFIFFPNKREDGGNGLGYTYNIYRKVDYRVDKNTHKYNAVRGVGGVMFKIDKDVKIIKVE